MMSKLSLEDPSVVAMLKKHPSKEREGETLYDDVRRSLLKTPSMVTKGARGEKPSRANLGPRTAEKAKQKYGNKKIVRFGKNFDSIWEADCYSILHSMQQRMLICDLETQVHVSLIVNDVEIVTPRLDFAFKLMNKERTLIYADAKSWATARTDKWRIYCRLIRALKGHPPLTFEIDGKKTMTDVEKVVMEMHREIPSIRGVYKRR